MLDRCEESYTLRILTMPINTNHLKDYVIKPALEEVGLYSKSAVQLLLGTCAQESEMGKFLKQIGGGPALGIYQMEPNTHDDIWENFLSYNRITSIHYFVYDMYDRLDDTQSYDDLSSLLVYDLRYATIMARLHYYRVSEALPDADDVEGLALYWKTYYNTEMGKGTVTEFIRNYERYVL